MPAASRAPVSGSPVRGGGGGNVGIGSGHIETPGEFTLIIDNPSNSHTKLLSHTHSDIHSIFEGVVTIADRVLLFLPGLSKASHVAPHAVMRVVTQGLCLAAAPL